MSAIGTSDRARTAAATSSTPSGVVPAASARSAACWMVGPSAIGSENGIPISSRSAPPSTQASAIAFDVARSGSPPITYVTSAASPRARQRANARGDPVSRRRGGLGAWGACLRGPHRAPPFRRAVGRGRRFARERTPVARRPPRRLRPRGERAAHLVHVLVAAAGHVHHDEAAGPERAGDLACRRDGVSRLERRDDALRAREVLERLERLVVGGLHEREPAGVLEVRELGSDAGIVEARR